MSNDIKVGDKVTHWSREEDGPGTVVEVEPDKYSFDDPTYHVVWHHDKNGEPVGPAIPYRRYHYLAKIHPFVPLDGDPDETGLCAECKRFKTRAVHRLFVEEI